MARCSSSRHLRVMVGEDDDDRRKSQFSRRAATVLGVPFGFATMSDRRRRLLLAYRFGRGVNQVGRHCVSAAPGTKHGKEQVRRDKYC